MDGSAAGLYLSKLDYACDTSPYINLDAWALRQRLLDTGSVASTLDSGLDLKAWLNTGASATSWAAASAISTTAAVGRIKAVDSLPAVSSMHATLAAPQTIQWAPTGSVGATFCAVAKLPAKTTANSNQFLVHFSPAFSLARDGTAGDMAVTVGATKGKVAGAFDGKWHSYVAVVSGKTTALYVDGVAKSNFTHAAVSATSSKATTHLFGAPSQAPNTMLNGDLRQFLAWRRPLSAAELAGLHAQLKAKWKL
jgi:hypothetical protein